MQDLHDQKKIQFVQRIWQKTIVSKQIRHILIYPQSDAKAYRPLSSHHFLPSKNKYDSCKFEQFVAILNTPTLSSLPNLP